MIVPLAGWILFALPGGESPSAWPLARADETPAGPEQQAPPAETGPAADSALVWLENLRLHIYGNVLGNRDDERVNDPDGNQIDDRIRLRELDIDFDYVLSDSVNARVILSYESDPVSSHEADLAEAWIGYHTPFGSGDAWDVELRAGKFRTAFGQNAQLRVFDLPQPTRPLPVRYYLGEDGLTSTGVSGRVAWTPAREHELAFQVEGIDSGDLPLTDAVGEQPFASVLRLGYAFTGTSYGLEAGVSSYEGRKQPARLNGADLLLSRRSADPHGAGTFYLGGEVFEGQTEFTGIPDEEPQGWYAWAMLAVLPDFYLGVRVDEADEVVDANLATRSLGVYGTWVASEFARVAVGWESFQSDVPSDDGRDSVYLEINFALGPAPQRPFWVR